MRYSHPSRAAVVRVKSKTLGWFVRLGREQQKWNTIKRERRLRIMLFTWSYACQVVQYLAFLSSPFCVNALLNLAIIELLTRHVSSVQLNWQNPKCTKICCSVFSRRMIVHNELKEEKTSRFLMQVENQFLHIGWVSILFSVCTLRSLFNEQGAKMAQCLQRFHFSVCQWGLSLIAPCVKKGFHGTSFMFFLHFRLHQEWIQRKNCLQTCFWVNKWWEWGNPLFNESVWNVYLLLRYSSGYIQAPRGLHGFWNLVRLRGVVQARVTLEGLIYMAPLVVRVFLGNRARVYFSRSFSLTEIRDYK